MTLVVRDGRQKATALRTVPIGLVILLMSAGAAFGETYHVDCAAGSDAAAGTGTRAAWKTAAKVSASTFAPGDAVLFRRGTRCQGMLWPKGSGDAARPIRIGSYGEGVLPVIDGGTEPAALKLFNQQGWHIEQIETVGGSPHGIYIGGDVGPLTHFRIRNVVVRHVTGELKSKYSGLVVVDGTPGAVMQDVVIDGVIAHDTTQWAGVIVVGPSRESRSRDVTVRNTIVHNVFGDGIVLYQVEDGLIEKSAAWLTGLQPELTIGTPNGIWTWRCRRCVVQFTEGFFTDSPGIDGGVYDIDWGNEDNTVQYNYGHDAQGYCLSVFGASGETTSNSIVRHNVCVNNGRSPKLARRQGDVFIQTWDGGSLDGVLLHNNTFSWTPSIDAPAVRAGTVTFAGDLPNRFFGNVIQSAVPFMIDSSAELQFDGNVYWYAGLHQPRWRYGNEERAGPVGGEFVPPRLDALLRPPAGPPPGRDVGASAAAPATVIPAAQPGRWTLTLFPDSAPEDARSQLVFLEAALAQYGDTRLDAVVLGTQTWPLDKVRAGTGEDSRARLRSPGPAGQPWPRPGEATMVMPPQRAGALLTLTSPSGELAREWRTLAPPADLGLTLRHVLGPPHGCPPLAH